MHFLAEDQPLVRRVFLRRGQQEVGGLLPSPLITLNDSNGHTFEIKSTYSHAHVHTHTGHSHTDLALRSARLLHKPSSGNGSSPWASFTRGETQTSGLLFLILFSLQSPYSPGSHASYKWSFKSSPRKVKKPRKQIKHAFIFLSTLPCSYCDATMML